MTNLYHPKPIVETVKTILILILLTIPLVYFKNFIESIFLQLLLGMWAIGILYALMIYIFTRFHTLMITDAALIYSSGILSKKQVVLPFSKITEANYHQNIVERVFGVGTLRIDTPGGSETAIHLAGMAKNDVKVLLDAINAHSGK